MAELVQKTYASSLFEVALSQQKLDEVFDELISLKQIVSENPTFVEVMCSPVIEKQNKHQIILNVFEGKISEYVYNFIKVLIDNSRFDAFDMIIKEFEHMYNQHNNIASITVITAVELSEQLEQKLLQKLEQVTGKRIKLVKVIDKEIIGGIMLRYDNLEIDSTVKTRLADLKNQLINIIA